ncbi:MAG: FecR family protein [Balneolaceae bacterium]|jgi:hypothetical protein
MHTKQIIKSIFPLLLLGTLSVGAYLEKPAERPLAFVRKFKPKVGLEKAGKLQNVKKRGEPLYNGDTLRTDENGFALVQFMDKSLAKVKPQSQLVVRGEVKGKNNTSTRIGLEVGEIFLNVAKQGSNKFEVATQTSVATVKGTKFGVEADNYFWVQEGVVQVLSKRTGKKVDLTRNQYGRVTGDGDIKTGELSDKDIKKKEEEYSDLNDQLKPKIYNLRFIDNNGQQRVIKLKVFENQK